MGEERMSELDKLELDFYTKKSNEIQSGKIFLLYLMQCIFCQHKRLNVSPPVCTGGTLSCPVCRIKKENGPGIESSYGRIRTSVLRLTLPRIEDVK